MNKKIIISIILIIATFFTNTQYANEIQIYADNIDYDSDKNLIAKGNVKIIRDKEILISQTVIINEKQKKIILPEEFQYRDEQKNYYFGSSGEFSTNFENATIYDYKMLTGDGSRIVGRSVNKKGKIDVIHKGVFTPCTSKIKIKDFKCPIWQLEAEKFVHDRDKLFIHQKHSKMRVFNVPVFYFPYFVSPSPLRTKRKSGFLVPSVNFFFFDTQTSQSTSIPYYFAISEDKELTLTPTLNYGGGVDSSQTTRFEYIIKLFLAGIYL